MKPKYLQKMANIAKDGMLAVNGNRLLIELLDEEERTTKSGIVTSLGKLPAAHAMSDRARVAVVLVKGSGYTVEEEGKEPKNVDLPYEVGDSILVNQFGVKTFADFFGLADYKPDTIGLITDDLVQGTVDNFEKLSAALKA